jgi:hypothetical protein
LASNYRSLQPLAIPLINVTIIYHNKTMAINKYLILFSYKRLVIGLKRVILFQKHKHERDINKPDVLI